MTSAAIPTSARRSGRPRAGFYVFLFPAILAFLLIAIGSWNARNRSGNEATRLASKELDKALKKVPFAARLPQALPSDAKLVRTFMDEPDSGQGFQVYQLNTWYRSNDRGDDDSGVSVHIWQTNDNFLARELRDPTKFRGTKETVAGARWNVVVDERVRYHTVTTYSRRFDDGITMTVSAPKPAHARAAILALRLVDENGKPLPSRS